jgi:hypothetical protein
MAGYDLVKAPEGKPVSNEKKSSQSKKEVAHH